MSDFIREVDEDYRRERVIGFLKRYQVPLALLVVLIVVGAGGWRWYGDRRLARAQEADARYQDAATLARGGQGAQAEAGFRALAGDGPAGYALLARLRGAEMLAATDREAAARQLDAIASDDGLGAPALRDLARYRGALLRIDTQDPKAFDAQYGRFALESFTFTDGMRELLALAALKRGDRDAAARYVSQVMGNPLATPALRSRVEVLRELVTSGNATAVAAVPGAPTVRPLNGGPAAEAPAPVETLPAEPSAAAAPPVPVLPATAVPAPATPAPATPAPETPAAAAPAPGEPPPAR